MAKILVVEDEESINHLICRNLELVGHCCIPAADGESAIEIAEAEAFDLVLLDVMLPKKNGIQVYQQMPKRPTIFLTAKSRLADRLEGLTLGADDYITKPFEMLELLARVEAVLRRTLKKKDEFRLKELRVNFESHQIFLREAPVDCTPKEYGLLEMLIRNRNVALSREQLLDQVWGYDFEGDTRTVDVHIQKLRKKLDLDHEIKTVYKLGYRLEVQT